MKIVRRHYAYRDGHLTQVDSLESTYVAEMVLNENDRIIRGTFKLRAYKQVFPIHGRDSTGALFSAMTDSDNGDFLRHWGKERK